MFNTYTLLVFVDIQTLRRIMILEMMSDESYGKRKKKFKKKRFRR